MFFCDLAGVPQARMDMRRGNCYPSTRGIPLRTELCVDSCSVRHPGNCLREHTRHPRHPHTGRKEMFMRQQCCTRAPQPLLDLCAQRNKFQRKDCCVLTPRAHLDLFPCTNRHVPATTAAFARCEHTWISLRAQTDMFMRQHCCVLMPRAQLDLSPCANRHVPAKKIAAFSRRENSWISLRAQKDMFRPNDFCVLTPRGRSVRKETCSIEKIAAIPLCPPR